MTLVSPTKQLFERKVLQAERAVLLTKYFVGKSVFRSKFMERDDGQMISGQWLVGHLADNYFKTSLSLGESKNPGAALDKLKIAIRFAKDSHSLEHRMIEQAMKLGMQAEKAGLLHHAARAYEMVANDAIKPERRTEYAAKLVGIYDALIARATLLRTKRQYFQAVNGIDTNEVRKESRRKEMVAFCDHEAAKPAKTYEMMKELYEFASILDPAQEQERERKLGEYCRKMADHFGDGWVPKARWHEYAAKGGRVTVF